jgi:O-succinylhomoserine sulfhydrylase
MSNEGWGYRPRNERPAPDWETDSQTDAVRAGLSRTGFGETSEALFLTSGFTYSSAQEALDSFTDQTDHFLYSRFHNPTVDIFEKRLAAI